MSIFETLYEVDVSGKTEKKNGLTYLSWAWAWAEVKKRYPMATYTIYENKDGLNYHHDGRTAWVKTGVTIDGLEHIEYLPVMDFRNKSIKLNDVTSYDVNKTIQRSLTKALARHGLGLCIYAGEDLPESEPVQKTAPKFDFEPKGGATTPAEKKEIGALLAGVYPDGSKVFSTDEAKKYSAMRKDYTAREVINAIRKELQTRTAPTAAMKTAGDIMREQAPQEVKAVKDTFAGEVIPDEIF